MKDKRNRLRKYCILQLFLFTFSTFLFGQDDLKSLSDYLDYIINNKQLFTEQKEKNIHSLKQLLGKGSSSLEYEYEINLKLYNEYKKFKLDSAIHYAERNVRIAEQLNSQCLKIKSDINLAGVYSYSGRYLEAGKILASLDSHKLPNELLPDYYATYSRYYEHYGATSNQRKYSLQVELYRDSLIGVLDPSSFQYKIQIVHKYIIQPETEKASELLNHLLDTEEVDSPEYALITHYLGAINGMKGNTELQKKYYTLSAIADIKNSIKENASFQRLALIYYNSGDIPKAFKYSQSAIEDAVFSGVQFRTAQMSEFYSIISASYQAKETKTNSQLRTYLVWISILSVFLIVLVAYVYKQMKKLSRIKEELSETNNRLVHLNKELNGTNELINERNILLWESNHIKEQYIAQFFDLCSTYIDKMEENRKALYKLGINRQFEDLMGRLKSTTVFDNELEELYAHFDKIFLNLYPTFVTEFNALLSEDERIQLKSDDSLNRELRIYALLILGISDSTKIAGFLRCSMSTIYNYRTRMRNKAATNREEFEDLVMKIGRMDLKGN